ncbi:MAG: hypothetical protein QXU20_03655 [Candidatus Woesearchaeota archaeon]
MKKIINLFLFCKKNKILPYISFPIYVNKDNFSLSLQKLILEYITEEINHIQIENKKQFIIVNFYNNQDKIKTIRIYKIMFSTKTYDVKEINEEIKKILEKPVKFINFEDNELNINIPNIKVSIGGD